MISELKLLDIDVKEFDKRLRSLNAVAWPEKKLRRNLYSLDEHNWIKLQDERRQVMLEIRNRKEHQVIKLDANFEKASVILQDLGHTPTAYHEVKDSLYLAGDIMVNVMQWPKIPPYAELSGPEAKVNKLIKRLGFSVSNAKKIGTKALFRLYGIELEKQKNLKF